MRLVYWRYIVLASCALNMSRTHMTWLHWHPVRRNNYFYLNRVTSQKIVTKIWNRAHFTKNDFCLLEIQRCFALIQMMAITLLQTFAHATTSKTILAACTNSYGDHYKKWMRLKLNFHQIWITAANVLMKWTRNDGLFGDDYFSGPFYIITVTSHEHRGVSIHR